MIFIRLRVFLTLFAVVSGVMLFGAAPGKPQRFELSWKSEEGKNVSLEVTGLPSTTLTQLPSSSSDPEWRTLLAVYVDDGRPLAAVTLPPMAGRYSKSEGTLRFTPLFPLQPGITYRAWFRPRNLPGKVDLPAITSKFKLPPQVTSPQTRVTEVYPTTNTVPENLLKFYVHFSASMSRGGIYDYIHLQDSSGKEVELPFLEIDEELWNPDMTRLTLFFDPGRIKRGVKPLEDVGPALEADKAYKLIIDPKWPDASGVPMVESFVKEFTVTSPDRKPPSLSLWSITPPQAGTKGEVVVVFPEPLDHALSQRLIDIVSENGHSIAGTIRLASHQERWLFTPDQPWQEGSYKLLVQTTLEDLAGNTIQRPFEVDLFDGVQRRLTSAAETLPFDVR